ncbi:MAG TPA: ATP-binding protein [Solirubrobacterales bacterium]
MRADGAARIELTEPARPPAIPILRRAARELALANDSGEQLADDVALAVSEAATNAVKYAYRTAATGTVRLFGEVSDGWLEITIADRGEGFGVGPSEGLGLGLIIIARLCNDLRIVQEGTGTTVRMRFLLP